MNIQRVPVEWVPQVWPRVERFIAAALEHTDDFTVEEVRTLISLGHWLLVVAADGDELHGAAAVQFFNRPRERVAFVMAIGGRLISGPDTFEQLKTLLKGHGATTIEGAARESIARLWQRYGFTEAYRIVRTKL